MYRFFSSNALKVSRTPRFEAFFYDFGSYLCMQDAVRQRDTSGEEGTGYGIPEGIRLVVYDCVHKVKKKFLPAPDFCSQL